MSLLRSKSAPLSVSDLAKAPIPRSTSHVQLPAKPVRATTLPLAAPPTGSQIAAGRSEREDPFNLGGFFPRSASGVLDEAHEWSWIRSGHDGMRSAYSVLMLEDEEEEECEESGPATPGAVKQSTGSLIRGEDKMGVLSITTESLFLNNNREGRPAEDRLFSPYSEEEPVDHDSLYQTLAKRRNMHTETVISMGTQFGELFLLGGEEVAAEDTAYWGSFLHGAMGLLG